MNIVWVRTAYEINFVHNAYEVKFVHNVCRVVHIDKVVLRERIIVDPELNEIYSREQTDALLSGKIGVLENSQWSEIDNILE